MNDHEIREWLGVAPADIPTYPAMAALVALYFVQNSVGDMFLAAAAFILSIIACVLGMRPDDRLSAFTNTAKLIGYPFFVLIVLSVICLNYTGWAGRHP